MSSWKWACLEMGTTRQCPSRGRRAQGRVEFGSRPSSAGSGDVRRVLGQRGDRDGHVSEEREAPEDLVELRVAVDGEDAQVRVLADAPPDVAPVPGALPLLGVGLLA